MKSFSSFYRRIAVVFAACLCSPMVGAQTLNVDGSTRGSACVGEPIVLTGSGFDSGAADLYMSVNGGAYTKANVTAVADPTTGLIKCVLDMGDKPVQYYMVDQKNTSKKSNSVSVDVSHDCEEVCHITSTGDYYLGTDFNPTNGNPSSINWGSTPPGGLESYFQDNNITFWRNCNNGSVVQNWRYAGGSTYPHLDRDPDYDPYYNYYYVFQPQHCDVPFKLGFPNQYFKNKYYRFVMRLYVDLSECGNRTGMHDAMMNIRTDFGNDSYNSIDIDVYNDANNTYLTTISTGRQGHLDNVRLSRIQGGSSVFEEYSSVKYFRMDITFYGQFLGTQGRYDLYPQFQQWDNSCMKVAIDYISAEVEGVCMDKGAVCIGDNAIINAKGFPKGANYIWEMKNASGAWVNAPVNGFDHQLDGRQSVQIPVDFLGKREYRVRASGSHGGQNYNINIPFTVTGKDCEPIQPTDIQGPKKLCVPNTREEGMFSVFPLDANENVKYTWSFTTPRGEVFGSDKLSFSGGELLQDTRGGSVFLVLNSDAEEGKYTMNVQPVQVRTADDGVTKYEVKTGSVISSTFEVYRTPRIQIVKEGTDPLKQSEIELCPTDRNQKVVAVADVKSGFSSQYVSNYVYTWKDGAKGKTDAATVDFPALGSCDGSYKKHTVSVSVQINNVGCPTTAEQSWNLGKIVKPTIDCNSLNDFSYTLGETEKTRNVEFPFPDFTAGCETDPQQSIVVNFTPKSGSKITKTFEGKRSEVAKMSKVVALPAGEGTVTYTVTDGCGNYATCTKVVVVKDVTPPSVPCDEIPKYTTKLSLQEGCDATPDFHHTSLPTLKAPVLEDANGVDGSVTGVYRGRLYNPGYVPNAASMFDDKVALNDHYLVGLTYILWQFTDASGNASFCIQTVEVIDDRKPNVVCPEEAIGEVANKQGFCGLSLNGLVAQMKELPTAKDTCTVGPNLERFVFYRDVMDDEFEAVPNNRFDDIIFLVDHSYEIRWRFYKLNDPTSDIFEDCIQNFTVRDMEAPYFDCSLLQSIRVTANSYKPKNKGFEYLTYATKDDVEEKHGPETYLYTGTLKEAFESGKLRMISPNEVKDNCDDNVIVEMTLEGPDDKGKTVKMDITKASDLEKHRFGIGLTTINYTFIDMSGNESQCSQTVIVTAGTTPVPDCPAKVDTVLYADNNCSANFVLRNSLTPTAMIPVNQEGAWFNFRYCVIGGLHFDKECTLAAQYFPDRLMELNGMHTIKVGPNQQELTLDYLCDQLTNDWDKFSKSKENKWKEWSSNGNDETILDVSNSLTTVKEYLGYPYEVELLDSTGTSVKLVKNPYTAEDVASSKVITARWFGSGGTESFECPDISYTCTTLPVKVKNNFEDVVMNVTLTRGVYTLVYRFQNEKDGLQQDSCVLYVNVVDTIAPTLDCGDWNNSGTFYANDQCVVPVEEIPWFKKPTLDDLNVKDNCYSDPSDFTITWNRHWNYDITADIALTDPLLLGTTIMTWYVTDASGNVSQCEQVITVLDTTGPAFDCSLLSDIVVETETNCEASANTVKKAGLAIPYAADDACSPTGGSIPGEGVRSDGKDLFNDAYPRGTTIITWTFKDAAGNPTVCTQKVIVEDRTAPVYADCGRMPEVVIELPADMCAATKEMAKVALGFHIAIDDCDGDIPGVPHVMLPGDTVFVDLYESFRKDTSYHIVWTFTDLSGNELQCDQMLTIRDTTAPDPSAVCPPPTKHVAARVVCSVNYEDLQLPTTESMKVTDPCDGDLYPTVVAKIYAPDGSFSVYYNDELLSVEYPVGTHTFHWIYTDKAGNMDTCTMNLTVDDSIPPVLEDCGVDPDIHLTVDGDICAIAPANVKALIREPKAYDECDDYLAETGLTWMDPVVERYFIDSTLQVSGTDTLGYTYDSTKVADGVSRKWDVDPFPKGLTLLRWIFTDRSGNSVMCEKTVTVHDFTPPYFDCDDIDPDTLRPEAYKGDCEVEFGNLKRDVLDKLAYKAWDACAGDSIPGVLTLNGDIELPEEYTMSVGITYKLIWMFEDEDHNKTTCPQYILPSHLNDIDFDCNTIKDTVAYAEAGTCGITADSLRLHVPVAIDSCAVLSGFGGTFEAVGFRSDSLTLKSDYPTGHTHIDWMFVSPWNLHDTLWCDQDVFIRGNKHFDMDCDVLTPTRRDTLDDCGPTDPLVFVIDTPKVADPCIVDENSPEYWRVGVGTRSDNNKLDAPFSLGVTSIQWVFTDFTESISDTCNQDVVVKTSLEMIFDCDALNKDTIAVDVVVGECTVDASKVKEKIKTPFALHPCPEESGVDTIWGVPSRRFGMSMDSSFYVGLSEIVWTFIDTSATILHDTVTCSQWVRVGDVNEMPVKCENYPDAVYRLSPNDCEISWKEMEIQIPGVVDLCSHNIIDPVVTRSSGKNLTAKTTLSGTDTIVVIEADPFTVGVDTVRWSYSFQGQLFVCDQIITVKDSMAPIYDCDNLSDLVVPSIPGKCYVNASAVFDSLPNPWPQAEDVCNKQKIDGRVYLEDGRELSRLSSFTVPVGNHVLTWIFIDETINEIADTCSQKLLVIGDQAPIFDCSSLQGDTILIEGCDTTLGERDIPTPYALDACTGDSIEGVGFRMDYGPLYGKYPVGTTQIRWIFVSPFSTLADTCIQNLTILTKQELDLHCSDVNGDTVHVDVEEGECFTPVDLKTPFALHPCPEQSKVDTIWGVPYRSDSRAFRDSFRTGITVVTWVFTDKSGTMYKNVDTCYTVVSVGDVNKMPVDCNNMPDTTIILPPTDCEISWKEINFSVPEVRDLCSDSLITPTLTRWSGKTMDENFTVGPDTVYWNYNFFGQIVTCHQGFLVLDSVAPDFDCSVLKDTLLVAKDGECEVSSEEFVAFLGDHVAIDSCTGKEVHGRAFVCDVISPFDDTISSNVTDCVPVETVIAKVGETLKIHWIFQDTLLNAVAKECDQTVTVKGTAEPIFDCSSLTDTILYLALDQCELPKGSVDLNVPVAKDSCTGLDVKGVGVRRDSLALTDFYPRGVTVVDWTFTSPYSINSKSCPQNVVVKDTFPPQFPCDTLQDTIKVRITMTSISETEVSYDEVEAGGLYIPSIQDACDGLLEAVGTRSDGLDLKSNFSLGNPVVITWTFSDSSKNVHKCEQVVLVEDWLIEDLVCPEDLNGKVFACVEDVPAPYADYEAFKAAGGSFTNETKLLPNTFSYEDRYEGDSCVMTFTRTYHVEDFRHNDITCDQVLYVKDTIAPVIQSDLIKDITVSCTDTIAPAATLTATDNCDPSPKVTIRETNDRGNDPSACEYFNYDIVREYEATDRCGNKSVFKQVISVRDTTSPQFNVPEGWRDTVLAKNYKECIFGVPDMVMDIRSLVSDDCSDNDIRILQVPSAGTRINKTTRVWFYAYDKCDNVDSLSRVVQVQHPETIVELTAKNIDTCVYEGTRFSLSNSEVRFASGIVLFPRIDGSFRRIPSVFSFDYYKGDSVDVKNLIFSDNSYTYRSLFSSLAEKYGSHEAALEAVTRMTKNSQSGSYTFVAMDTTTGCSDTATAYVNIAEMPRVRIDNSTMHECEGNMIDLDAKVRCEAEMGAPITKRYWTLNGEPFDFADSTNGVLMKEYNNASLVYVAKNRCGESLSSNSLFMFCDDKLSGDKLEDSIKFFGSVEKYELYKNDQYYVHDSIVLDVHQRYAPDSILVETEPSNPTRIWKGETALLTLKTQYPYITSTWYKVVGSFDREFYDYKTAEYEYDFYSDTTRVTLEDEKDEVLFIGTSSLSYIEDSPIDTSYYYVTIDDGVCPSSASSLIRVDVITKLPTAFTPYEKDGFNDIFMERHPVVIFDRYGQKVFEGENGWDGTHKGHMADPGVYFYTVVMIDGSVMNGTIEIVKIDH